MGPRRGQSSSDESKTSDLFSQLSVSSYDSPVEAKKTAKPETLAEENSAEDEDSEELPFRELADVDFREFEPIWINGEPSPENLPDEVKELVNACSRAVPQMVGSMRTILHVSKCDDLVSLFYDPACSLEDEVIIVPGGTSPEGFILRTWMPEGKIPYYFIQKYLGFMTNLQTVRVFPAFEIPSAVTGNLEMHRLQDIYPNGRPQCFPEAVQMVHLKWQKNTEKFAVAADRAFNGALLNKPGLFFRGLSLKCLARSTTLFLPVIDSQSADNEFGPGIYTSDNFDFVCSHAGSNGAIMVFENLDARELNVWRPGEDEWNNLVATCLDLPLGDSALPPGFKDADIITGPIPAGQREARKKRRFPAQDKEVTQSTFVSYKSCERLMASLTAIIYVSR